jgi:hypothetical protein
VTSDVDDMYRRAQSLSLKLDAMSEDDPKRANVLRARDRLRSDARKLANSARHPLSVETETAMLLARLEEIDDLFVTKGYAEKHLTQGFSDPGAYSATINRTLADDHAAEIAEIELRLSDLRSIDLPDIES